MTKIVNYLLSCIKFQVKIITLLLVLLTIKNIFPKSDGPIRKKYRTLQIYALPIIEVLKKFD